MSPARRIFDDDGTSDGSCGQSGDSTEMLRSQSVMMFAPVSDQVGSKHQRSKSTTSVHCDSVPTGRKNNSVDSGRQRKDSESAMEVSQICQQSEKPAEELSERNESATSMENQDRVGNSDGEMEVCSPTESENMGKKSPYHTIRKPAVVKCGGIWTVPSPDAEDVKIPPKVDSHVTENCIESVQRTLNIEPARSTISNLPQKDVVNSHIYLKQILNNGSKPSVPHLSLSVPTLHTSPTSSAITSLPENSSKQAVINSTSSVSARSAFVPFSQVHSRKDLPCEISVTNLLCDAASINRQKCKSMENLSQPGFQNEGIKSESISSNTSVVFMSSNPSMTNSETLHDNLPSIDQLVSIPTTSTCSRTVNSSSSLSASSLESNLSTLTVDTSSAMRPSPCLTALSTTTSVSASLANPSDPNVPSSIQSSPVTPTKKSRSRFTPIRPKASPAKTVSSILKENKPIVAETEKYDKSRPVAELLKEKRAREAQLQSIKTSSQGITTSVTTQIQQYIQQPLPISAIGNLPGRHIAAGDKNQFFIILSANPLQQTGNAAPVSTVCTKSSLGVNVDSTSAVIRDNQTIVAVPRTNRSRTSSSSEREFDSPMPMSVEALNSSDYSDCSVNNDEKPSKLIKIVDNDHNVSSRPGSRGSVEREETPLSFLGRKRKLLSAESFTMRQTSKKMDSLDDGEEDLVEVDSQRSLSTESVKKNLEKMDSFGSNSSSKSGQCGNQHYPSISDLENDALLDISDDQLPLVNKSRTKVASHKNQQSTAVGVTSLSLTRQKFLKEKMLLDKRMKLFSQQKEDVAQPEEEIKSFQQTNKIVQPLGVSNPSPAGATEMEVESELPPEVADFITDAMTGIENTRIHSADPEQDHPTETMVSVDYSKSPIIIERQTYTSQSSIPHMEKLLKIKEHLQSFQNEDFQTTNRQDAVVASDVTNKAQNNTYQNRSHSVTFYEPDVVANINTRDMVRSQSVTFPDVNKLIIHGDVRNQTGQIPINLAADKSQSVENAGSKKSTNFVPGLRAEEQSEKDQFVSPQRPARRQRTPSVERSTNQTPNKFTSPIPPTMSKRTQREVSIDRMINQTPYSDPGYGSVGPSPVPGITTLPSNPGLCDSTYSSMTSSHLSGRPDSAQSLTSDNVAPSPISLASPRFSTSTPYPLRSPCPTPGQNMLMSPGPTENSGPIRFMPIQGTSYKTNNSVTLIKPVVTVASHSLSDDGRSGDDQNCIVLNSRGGGANTAIRPPPPYTAAVQQQQQANNPLKSISLSVNSLTKNRKEGAFILLTENTKVSEEPMQSSDEVQGDPTPHFVEKHGQNAYPFSNFFAQLSGKNKNVDVVLERNPSKTAPLKDSRGDNKTESIKKILGHLKSPLSHTKPQITNLTNGHGQAMQNFSDLPNVNYRGNQPNVDISGMVSDNHGNQLLNENQIVTSQLISDEFQIPDQIFHEDQVFCDNTELTAKRNLTFNDEFDLQTTLDDLKDVDGEYFEHENSYVYGTSVACQKFPS